MAFDVVNGKGLPDVENAVYHKTRSDPAQVSRAVDTSQQENPQPHRKQ